MWHLRLWEVYIGIAVGTESRDSHGSIHGLDLEHAQVRAPLLRITGITAVVFKIKLNVCRIL